MDLCAIGEIRRLLEKYGQQPKKGYGQNFLTNRAIPEKIAESAAFGDGFFGASEGRRTEAAALEIGPGIGCLTKELALRFSSVTAVEIDSGLIPLLGESLADFDNIEVVNTDFMKLDLDAFLSEHFAGKEVRVAANLPYYITTPVLMKLLDFVSSKDTPKITSITAMVQLEVADRLCAKAGTAEYGAITAAVNLRGTARRLFTVSAGNFLPQPKVDSAVIEIKLYENGVRGAYDGFPDDENEAAKMLAGVKELISLAFGQRRKTLTNTLAKKYDKQAVGDALEVIGFPRDVRGERLSAYDFCRLYDGLNKVGR